MLKEVLKEKRVGAVKSNVVKSNVVNESIEYLENIIKFLNIKLEEYSALKYNTQGELEFILSFYDNSIKDKIY